MAKEEINKTDNKVREDINSDKVLTSVKKQINQIIVI